MKYDLKQVLIIIVTTFIFTVLLVPIIKKISLHIGAVDKPNERRVNKVNMPNLGGLAIFSGFILGYMFFCEQTVIMNAILIGSFILIITGIIDSINSIKARYQLIAQIAAAFVVVFYGGLLLSEIDAFGLHLNFGIFAYPITIIFIVGMINVINLIDGLDGLAAGISSIYFVTIGVIAFIMNKTGGLDIVLSFIMLGSSLGFLVHNFHPAKIFMGQSGSMFLGFIISIIALLGFKNVTLTSFLVPILIMAVPILDTFFAILRRLINKQSIAKPDKQHLHHQLLKMNFSHRTTVLIIYYIDALFAFASIVYVLKDAKLGIFLYITLFIIVMWFVITTNIVVNKKRLKKKKLKK
ncbi:MAG TPA: undecaprenyl/decaprenyl-phosphate alpha-N-acetylglucosaminyl 1-phosphate transferase [Mollicutes bacterium]|nr:undecaprenyl/decaprenyl-phosphate alpha-N-acetylglucosaminyl 1-phosphate transferase [Mollicutes bacterium]